ncbi:MAG: Wzz/FepE/Etk N-terminal domain-containing protein [Panacagrimonas sp.]
MNRAPETPVPVARRMLENDDGEIDFREAFARMWDRVGLILLCTVLASAAAVAYALMATPIFRAEAVLSIRQDEQAGGLVGLAGQLGGLADLAGLTIPGSKDKGVAVATLKSRAVLEQFIADRKLVEVLIQPGEGGGLTGDDKAPTVWDAHRKFVKRIFKVVEDKKTGLVTVAVEWKDPQQATDWVTDIVARTNARMRSVAIDESEKNLAYLESQAKATNVIEIRQALFRLAENEIKKLMLAKGAGEYVFKTVDPARFPERRIRPKRTLIAIGGFVLGAAIGVFLALALPPRRSRAKIA